MNKFDDEMEREEKSSAKMLGVTMLSAILTIIIFLLASCSAPQPLTDYERHQIAWKEYLAKTDLRGTPRSILHEMWRTAYIETMINIELR
tara:strand:- start:1865 stop:2134 length:270 start_codon:yes stop_codon:yes gene_type:complete